MDGLKDKVRRILEEVGERLSAWESEFARSIMTRYRPLTEKQRKCAQRLWDKFGPLVEAQERAEENRRTRPRVDATPLTALALESLGVRHDSTLADVRAAYREALLANHPDKRPDDRFAAGRTKFYLKLGELLGIERAQKVRQ